MGKKIRAAKASLVAAFLAAGGTAAAKATPANAAAHTPNATGASSPLIHYDKTTPLMWGDALIRFLKLDGFPSYLKVDGFAALTNYYKVALMSDAAALYEAWPSKVSSLLDLYHKADAGPLSGILIGLDQYLKFENKAPLADYLKTEDGLNAYLKFQDFFGALQAVARQDEKGPSALGYFIKLSGISYLPAVQDVLGENGGGGDVIG